VPPFWVGDLLAGSAVGAAPDQGDLRRDAAGWPRIEEEYLIGRWHVADDPAPRTCLARNGRL
jgi:hypothetical protein